MVRRKIQRETERMKAGVKRQIHSKLERIIVRSKAFCMAHACEASLSD
jgi:hypothetical protein